jgi:hypothetical protein
VPELVDRVRKLLELVGKLLGYDCECLKSEEKRQLVEQLDRAIKDLEDWLKRAGAGELAARA